MEEEKTAIQSKTIVTNAVILGLIPVFKAFNIDIPQDLLLSLVPLINILLRLVTSKPITSGK